LIFAASGGLLGFGLGYGVAYIGRLFNFFLLDAALIGVLGGAILLLVGLAARIRPGKLLVVGCVVFTFASWVGQRSGEYRFALRAHTRASLMVLEESGEELDVASRARAQKDARSFFENNIKNETGLTGIWGYMEQQWTRGVLLLRFGGWSQRIPLPLTAVLMGQVLSSLAAFLITWMLIRRLEWLARCVLCGRVLPLPEGKSPGEEGEPQQEEEASEKCADCVALG